MLSHHFIPAENGSDKYIVLLHGFGGNYRVWKHQIPILARNYNILAINLPSHHEENIRNIKLSQIEPTLKSVADEILKVCDMYHIKEKQTAWMGVSLGTIFVKYIEAYHPEYISFGILVGAVATVNTLFTKVTEIFSKIGDKLPFRFVYHVFSYIIMPGLKNEESRNIFRKCAIALNKTEFKLWMKVFNQAFRFSHKFEHLETNIRNIYIIGDEDTVFRNGAIHEMKESHGKLLLLEKCGHVCNIVKKDYFNHIITPLLNTQFNKTLHSQLA